MESLDPKKLSVFKSVFSYIIIKHLTHFCLTIFKYLLDACTCFSRGFVWIHESIRFYQTSKNYSFLCFTRKWCTTQLSWIEALWARHTSIGHRIFPKQIASWTGLSILFNTSLISSSFPYVMSTSSAILNSFSARRFARQNLPNLHLPHSLSINICFILVLQVRSCD